VGDLRALAGQIRARRARAGEQKTFRGPLWA